MPGSGSIYLAGDTPPVASAGDGTDEAAFTSTAFIPGTVVVGASFTAPTSGIVLVIFGARIESNTVSRSVLLSVEVREGSTVGAGTVVSVASDDSALETPQDGTTAGATTRLQASRHRVVTGLTAGQPYNVRCMHRMSGTGNGDVFYREVFVQPAVS